MAARALGLVLGTLAASVGLGLGAGHPATAAIIFEESDPVALASTEETLTVELAQFDPTLGTLEQVTVTVAAEGSATVDVTNLTPAPKATTVSMSLSAILDSPAELAGFGVETEASQTQDLAAAAVGQFVLDPVDDISLSSDDPADLAAVTGTGTIAFALTGMYAVDVEGPATWHARGAGLEAFATVAIEYTYSVPPVAVDDTATVDEDSGATAIPVLANDTDADGGLMAIESVTPPANGAVVIIDGGAGLTYQPVADFCGPDSFDYALNGGSTATVAVTVTCINDPPVVAAATVSLAENSPNGAAVHTVGFTDADVGQTHSFAITAGDPGGVFAVDPATGAITVADASLLDFELTPSYALTVEVTDDGTPPLSGTATITVNLTDVNEAPVVEDDSFTVAEDAAAATAVGMVTFDDPDVGQTHAFAITGGNTGGAFAIDPATGAITVAGALDFETTPTYALTVEVTDNGTPALSGTATITINVTNVNEAPVAAAATVALAEDSPNGTAVHTVGFTDADGGQTHSFAITAGDPGGVFAIDPATGAITVADAAQLDFETTPSYALTVEVTDDGTPPLSGTATITVNLTNVNEAPVVEDDSFTVAEDAAAATAVGTVTFDDPDAGQTHSFAITAGNTGGAFVIDPATGAITVAGALDFETTPSYALTVEVTDNGTPPLSGTATITINVTNVNEAPVAAAATVALAENSPNGTAVHTVGFTDADGGQTHSFAITAGDPGGVFAIDPATGVITVADAAQLDFETTPSYALTVEVTDDGTPPLSGTATITVNLTNVNEAPVVDDDTFTVAEDAAAATAVGTVTFDDPDAGQTHAFAITGGNTGGAFAIDPATGAITVAGALDFETTPTYALTVEVTDNGTPALSGTATITINVTNVNEAPSIVAPPSVSAEHDEPTVVAGVSVADPDTGDIELTLAADNGTIDVDESASAAVVTGDGTDTVVITGTVAEINAILAAPDGVTYLNDPGFAGATDALHLDVDDLGTPALTASATVTIQFNQPPVAEHVTATINEGTPVVVVLSATDADDDNLTFDIVTGPTNGTLGPIGAPACTAVANTCTAQVTYTPTGDFNGADQFTYQASDGTATDTGTATITVNPVNDAPVLTTSGSTPTFTENGPAVTIEGGITATDVDDINLESGTVSITAGLVTGDTLTFTPAGGITDTNPAPDVLALTGSTTLANWQAVLQSIQYSTASDNPTNATRTVSFTVNDGTANSNTATKNVTVVPINDAPVVTAGGALAYSENQAATAIDTTITVNDVDNTNQTGATIQITSGCTSPQDVLSYVNALGISAQPYDAANCLLTLTGTTTVANYQTALRSVLYNNTSQDPTTAARTVTWTVTDGTTTSAGMTSTITVTAVNNAPVAGDFTFNGANAAIANTALVVNDPTDAAPNPTGVEKTVAGDLLAAATDVDTPPNLFTITATTVTNTAGSLIIEADGDLTYHPAPGFSGDAVFTYTLNDNDPDGNASDTGTITINVPASPRVWYVDNTAPAGGDGTSDGPFDALADVTGATGPDAAGDIIYLHTGTGTYTGGVTLLNTQTLHGAGTALTVSGVNLAPAGADPTVTNAAGNGVTLSSGNSLTGFTVADTTGFDIANTAAATVGALTVSNVVLNGSGGLFRADAGGALTVSLDSATTSAAGTSGIVIAGGATGSFTVAGATTINDATADGIAISNSAVNATFTGLVTIVNDGAGANGDGVDLSTNTGTYSFNGGATITVNGTGAFGFRAQSSGTVNIPANAVNQITSNSGTALLINPTTLNATLASVTSSGGSEGISLNGMSGSLIVGTIDLDGQTGDGIDITNSAGTVTINGGTIGATNDPAGIGIDINGGAAAVTINATVNKTTAGDIVEISGRTGGTVDFNANLTSTNGGGIDLTGNTGATIRFDGGMALSTGAAAAFNATGGGTIAVPDTNGAAAPNNTLATTTGTALNVANTTIHAEGLTFLSISAGSPGAGPVNGVVLNTTGTLGSLTVTGNGNTTLGGNSSGGVIQNATGYGISLTNTMSPSFTNMNIQDIARNGIDGTDVTNFTFANGTIATTGTASVPGDFEVSSIAFVDRSGANDNTIDGVVSVTGSVITDPERNAVMIETWAGGISTLTISSNSLSGGTTTARIQDAIHVFAQGSGTGINMGAIQNNTISGFRFLDTSFDPDRWIGGNGIRLVTDTNASNTPSNLGTGASPFVISENDIDGVGSNMIAVSALGRIASANVRILDNGTVANPMSNAEGLGISLFFGGNGTFNGLVHNNVIENIGQTTLAGSSGIGVQSDFGGNTGANTDVTNSNITVSTNRVTNTDGNGILATGINNAGTFNIRIVDNVVTTVPDLAARFGIRVQQSNVGTQPTVNLEMHGNDTAGGNPIFGPPDGIAIRKQDPFAFCIEGLSPSPATAAQAATYVNSQNPGETTTVIAGSGFTNCTVPDFPVP